jgi:UDP-N-acetyl-D-mannosaminuronic acid dehydrogenase
VNIAVVGLGYIGLPTAALFAEGGHRVYGFDVDPHLRRRILQRDIPSTEDPVRQAVLRALDAARLHVVDRIPIAQAYVLCLPTPTHEGKPDLSYVESAANDVARVAQPGAMLVLESTVPPGTTERVFEAALARAGKAPADFHIAHCPERVIPGAIVDELRANARVVGGRTPADAAVVRDLYATFCQGEIAVTTTSVAEFVKVVENTFRDVNIAFANELAIFAEELGLDVWETIALANKHPRVDILKPGPGVGGHCIPVDPHFLSDANPFATELIQTARRINERMPYRIVRRIAELFEASPDRKIAILGAAYKADVDDARESPALRIDTLLRERGYATAIYDPLVTKFERPLCGSVEEAVEGADAVVLVTPHAAFRSLDPREIAALVRTRRLIDTRNFFDAAAWQEAGFDCHVLGSPPRTAAVATPA